MPDTKKLSELSAASSVATTDEFEINAGGTSKKATGQQVADMVTAAGGGGVGATIFLWSQFS